MDPKNISTREALIKGRLAMGRAFRNKGMYTQSLVHFKALLLAMPKSPEVHMEIGQTYMQKGDKRSASLEFQKVLEMDPKNREAKQEGCDSGYRDRQAASARQPAKGPLDALKPAMPKPRPGKGSRDGNH